VGMHFGWRKQAATKTHAARESEPARPAERLPTKHAHAEINAYISIRDRLLAEAEEIPTNSTLHRATIANDVVEIFLKPARPPYQAQHLPERDAAHERQRCETVKNRIAELRAKIATPAAGSVHKSQRPPVFGVRAIGTTPA
jgi:hypothetical protein